MTAEDIEKEFDFSDCRIGHPILLNDVLEWINTSQNITKFKSEVTMLEIVQNWNLPKPKLSGQSQELIDALCELIPK